jgi:hypothetical protein
LGFGQGYKQGDTEVQCLEGYWKLMSNLVTEAICYKNAPSVYLNYLEEEENINIEVLDEILETHLIDVDAMRSNDFNVFLRREKKNCIARFLRLWDKEDIITLAIAKLVISLGRIGQVKVLNR